VLSGFGQEGRLARHDMSVVGESAWVLADPTRLEQIIRNLFDNALKYTPPGGRISASVAPEGRDSVLRVRDTGIGIPPHMLPRIFDLFVQQPRKLDRAEGGLGLGLTVVKRLVDLHGGTVEASSAGTDAGSEFVVKLPTVAAGVDETSASPKAQPGEGHGIRRCRVAIVEDYADAREALEMVLRFDGHEVRTASDGPSGLALILAAQPNVAFIDIGLPGLTGYEIARRIRQAATGTDFFLVAITGYGQSFDRTQALEAGFDDHLVKPVDPGDLARVMARAGSTTE
jgi:CheY-like chemotaxis protein